MITKRLRIFAGPNGAGKSSLYSYLLLQNYFHQYFYINADEIAQTIISGYSVQNWPIEISRKEFFTFLMKSSFIHYIDAENIKKYLIIEDNTFIWTGDKENLTYICAAIADYLRQKMLKADSSFACETVFSHPSKLQFLREARKKGFKIYLYYVSTKNPEINIERVENRIQSGGHSVPEEKIKSRYVKTMNNLFDAVVLSDKAFLFDNSESDENLSYLHFATYEKAKQRISLTKTTYPGWFKEYFLDKITKK
ncbi:MAG: zeta toxin family protein [Spirochaetia bacterium]|nr:zeta toxin family protein [Spirochaetia bacterium]